jgi:hypothetical protein
MHNSGGNPSKPDAIKVTLTQQIRLKQNQQTLIKLGLPIMQEESSIIT